jgi:undecaprenyl-diphosphatase
MSAPLFLLATTVAYSRVHTGVHFPGDVVIGAAAGVGIALVTTRAVDAAWAATSG